ncbi:MAG TPA: hypothetical protein PK542_09340 [Treponemataceae bacterium]|nr:hypothetical protein [Treponemataceae bacterium]HPS44677.1 hypothetical protein [Treponemataceae bacterium]
MRGFPFARGSFGFARVSILLAFIFFSASSCAFDAPKSRLLSSSHAKEIAAIEIAYPGAKYPIRLERKKDSWFLVLDDTHRFPANLARVASFIKALREARTTRVFGQNGAAYGIDANESPRIRASNASGTVYLDLVSGSITAAGTAQYFHEGHIEKTIRVEPPLAPFVDGTTAYWANLTPFENAFQGSEIERASYKKRNYQRAFVRGSSENETELLDSFERALMALSCVDVTNIPFVAAESVTLELGDTSLITISIMPLNENYSIIRRDSDGASWAITKTAHDALTGSF